MQITHKLNFIISKWQWYLNSSFNVINEFSIFYLGRWTGNLFWYKRSLDYLSMFFVLNCSFVFNTLFYYKLTLCIWLAKIKAPTLYFWIFRHKSTHIVLSHCFLFSQLNITLVTWTLFQPFYAFMLIGIYGWHSWEESHQGWKRWGCGKNAIPQST